jgi:hypothetical protein
MLIPDSMEHPAVSSFLDRSLKTLEALRTRQLRFRGQITILVEEAGKIVDVPASGDEPLLAAVTEAKRELEGVRQELAASQARVAEGHRRTIERKQTKEELQALARLALRHLGEHCPVCAQTYDADATRERLEALLQSQAEVSAQDESGLVARLALLVEDREKKLASAEATLREGVRKSRERLVRENDFRQRLLDAGIDSATEGDALVRALTERASSLEAEASRLAEMIRVGERLSLLVARQGELARRAEVEREIETRRGQQEELDVELRRREYVGHLASRLLEGLRDAAYRVVATRLEEMGKVFQRIYSRIDPHPSFRTVKFLSKMAYGRGRVATRLEDEIADVASNAPQHVLSSSQMNAMAVSIFLALNLSLRTTPLRIALLDDPLQSLDDINLLGLVDLLRRVRAHRQLFVSTHDARFGQLLARKLRPPAGGRTRLIELKGWGRDGPVVVQRDAHAEALGPLRIAV